MFWCRLTVVEPVWAWAVRASRETSAMFSAAPGGAVRPPQLTRQPVGQRAGEWQEMSYGTLLCSSSGPVGTGLWWNEAQLARRSRQPPVRPTVRIILPPPVHETNDAPLEWLNSGRRGALAIARRRDRTGVRRHQQHQVRYAKYRPGLMPTNQCLGMFTSCRDQSQSYSHAAGGPVVSLRRV